MRKRKSKAGLLLGATLMLASCAAGGPASGWVVDKNYEPAHYENRYRCHYSYGFDGKYRNRCGYESTYVGDVWKLKMKEGEPANGKKPKVGWRYVSESTYDRCTVGKWCDT